MNNARVRVHQFIAALITFLICSPAAFAQGVNPKLDEYLTILTKSGEFSGSAFIARDGKVLLSKGVWDGL